jgi:DNA polymerase (family 10)
VIVNAGPKEDFGNRLLRSTGSDAHLAALEKRDSKGVLRSPSFEEPVLYERLHLKFVAPELREGRGEVERAAAGDLPRLLALEDIRGLFHVHSTWSDGKATLEEIFLRAVEQGHDYVGITEHSPAAAYARGLTPERVREQWAEIDALRPKFTSLTILRGTEADILPDGSVDYGDEFLAGFDFVIASVHSAFRLSRSEQTARLVRAVRNPRVTMLGHATGRLLLAREGFDVDLSAVLAAAGEAGCGVELNASPWRLDLDWRYAEEARRLGVFTAINPDAHDLEGLRDVRWGVAIARKGGFSPADVLNALPAGDLVRKLDSLRARG